MRTAITLASMLIAGTAFAQTKFVEVEDETIRIPALNATVDQLEDMKVYDAAGMKIGDVEDVLGATQEQPVAISIDADDFLGKDGEDVVVTLDQLRVQDGKLVTDLTKEKIAEAPRWNS